MKARGVLCSGIPRLRKVHCVAGVRGGGQDMAAVPDRVERAGGDDPLGQRGARRGGDAPRGDADLRRRQRVRPRGGGGPQTGQGRHRHRQVNLFCTTPILRRAWIVTVCEISCFNQMCSFGDEHLNLSTRYSTFTYGEKGSTIWFKSSFHALNMIHMLQASSKLYPICFLA